MGKQKYNTDTLIEEIKDKFPNNNWSFEKTVYKSYKDKVTITCHEKDDNGIEHGDFQISICHLMSGQGCPKCRYIKSASSKRRSIKELVEECRKVHGDDYDYSLITEYKNDRIKYPIKCNKCGSVFYQNMNNHIKGKQGCSVCGRKDAALHIRDTNDEFIEKAKKKGVEDYYDFLKVNMDDRENHDGKVCIICHKLDRFGNEHGEFWMTPGNFLHGQRCPKCANEVRNDSKRLVNSDFIHRANLRHNFKYDYSKTDVNTRDNMGRIKIICPEHGPFWQTPNNHLYGYGCPSCKTLHSEGEIDIFNYIKSIINNKIVINGYRPKDFNRREIDVYIPSLKFGIEYNGLYWHSEAIADRNDMLDKLKTCNDKGIRLFNVFEDEWIDKQDIVKSMLKNILGITDNRIYARKCTVKEVDYQTANDFLNSNHLQGRCPSKIRLGLFYNDELVSIMTFGKCRHFIGSNGGHEWELLRFCNKINTSVIGGASKLLSHFINEYHPKDIISYADRRWSDGNLYEKLGFYKYNESAPSYYYVVGGKRIYRYNLRKSVLVKKFGCPEDMSEHEFCLSKGWNRIYDCGCLCYIWENKNNK